MSYVKSISEILAEADRKETVVERAQYLYDHQSDALRAILSGAFDMRIKWLLPETDPPYTPTQLFDQEGMLYGKSKQLYLFVEGGHPTLNQPKREMLFIQMLETVCPDDARLLLAIKNKVMPYDNITEEVVNMAFPGLLTA